MMDRYLVIEGFTSEDTLSDRVYAAETEADKLNLPVQFTYNDRTYRIGPKP